MKLVVYCLLCILLSACGNTYYVYKENFRILFNNDEPKVLTWQQIAQSQFDLIEVVTEEHASLVLALAFIENGQHKFISADNSFFIFEQGRLVRTTGLKDNVLFTKATQPDPLALPLNALDGANWQFVQDVTTGVNLQASNHFYAMGPATISVLSRQIATLHFTEQVTYLHNGKSVINHYWFDAASGQLIRTLQHVPTALQFVDVTFLSRINRLPS
ncbi:hypothetical protein GCM10010919_17090 [Alishewanella longhuensis]|uniref:YjbF family lipoprotein n=1 Tax=Alishewanella longhuensis TaxID=1091037 RepID=A0ABQ3KXW8_9ALTE|nr:YjbF family lipoprotein [Alishewanella longhuensis]GHG67991.1 hypothetical protein GCM10010919_17090 [Alishewanella longhuensis]